MKLFSIANINCRYKGAENEVLTIESLEISKGNLTFVVGESGIGKSTLLETLGMMNNTIDVHAEQNAQFYLYPSSENQPANLVRYWKKRNASLLNELRNQYFSFVFQNNNLMDSFSAVENVMLSSLIQGANRSIASERASKVFKKLNISEFENSPTRLLSGGQKQRVAFARAFAKDFVVLFGDEPTGNLDPGNAVNLFQQLQQEIHQQNSQKGAVIVSHDIDMTLKFADEIVVITPKIIATSNNESLRKGIINKQNVFSRESNKWINYKKASYSNEKMKDLLLQSMTKNKEDETK